MAAGFHEETIRLLLEMQGGDSVKALTSSLEDLEQQLKDNKAAWEGGTIAGGEFLAKQDDLRAGIKLTENAMARLKGTKDLSGQGVMNLSYAFQDFSSQIGNSFTAAVGSVQNNIPIMLREFTKLSSGWIAGISAIGVAVGLLTPILIKAFGKETQDDIEETTKKTKELEDQVRKTHEAFVKMTEKPTGPEEEATENLKAILEAPGNAEMIRKALMVSMAPAGPVGMTDAQIRAGTEAAVGKEITPGTRQFEAEVNRRVTEATEQRNRLRVQEVEQRAKEAERIVTRAAAGDKGAIAAIGGLGAGALPAGLVREIAGSTPEAMAEADRRDAESDAALRQRSEDVEKRNARRKEKTDADKKWARAEKELAEDKFKEDQKQGHTAFDRFKNEMNQARQERLKGERGEAKEARQEQQQARRTFHQGRQQQENINADVERAINRANQAEIETAKANGATKEMINFLEAKADREREAAADQRRYWSRFMQKQEETVFGGQSQ